MLGVKKSEKISKPHQNNHPKTPELKKSSSQLGKWYVCLSSTQREDTLSYKVSPYDLYKCGEITPRNGRKRMGLAGIYFIPIASGLTVDGRNLAPVDMVNSSSASVLYIPSGAGFLPSTVYPPFITIVFGSTLHLVGKTKTRHIAIPSASMWLQPNRPLDFDSLVDAFSFGVLKSTLCAEHGDFYKTGDLQNKSQVLFLGVFSLCFETWRNFFWDWSKP